MSQLTPEAQAKLKKQQYELVGNHSAVKTCEWTKNMIRGKGGCYKLKFYGIMSNQCMQMTTSMSCANRCTFCWRDYKSPVSKEWKEEWKVDDPEFILKNSKKAHHKLLTGHGGNKNPNPSKVPYEKSKTIKHVALSLTGEPIAYPRMNELLEKFNKDGISTFLVTNAQYPDQIRDLKPVTQLYISLDAPNPKLLKKVDIPLFRDYWERLNQSLEYMSQKKHRTCIRLTLIKGMNMSQFEEYAEMINKGNPDFIEVKSYMWVGASRERLKFENMPTSPEVMEFTKELVKYLPDYDIVSEHYPSRVVMLAKKKFLIDNIWHTWIDFEKYNEMVNNNQEPETMKYLKKTPPMFVLKN